MRLVFGVVLCVCCLTGRISRALEISHQDLEDPNGNLCGPAGWCDEKTNRTNDLRSRNCMCDEKCDKYGDCCLNSAYFDAARQRRAASSFKCTPAEDNRYVYTKVDCPPLWRDAEVRRKCEKSAASPAHSVDDPLLMTPVTSYQTNVTYGNVFCAVCNRDSRRLAYWKLNVDCRSVVDGQQLTESYTGYVHNNLTFDSKLNYWRVPVPVSVPVSAIAGNDSSRTRATATATTYVDYKCDLTPWMAQPLSELVRNCRPMVKTCPATWGKDEIRQRCESYTLMVHRKSTSASSSPAPFTESFRNVHCAICNSVPVQSIGCEAVAADIDTRFQSFTILFDFNGGSLVGGQVFNCSGDGQRVYDRFFRRCRTIAAETETATATATATESPDKSGDDNGSGGDLLRETLLNCSEVVIFLDDDDDTAAAADEGNVSAPRFASGKYAYANRQQQRRRQRSEICREYYEEAAAAAASAAGIDGRKHRPRGERPANANVNVNTYRPYYSLITTLGIAVSIVCLCIHLVVFAAVKELRNLSGKNLASFCVALLLAYCSFALGDALDGKLCVANAVCTYYLFLAAFAWMLVMSFDVWRTLRIATKELRVSSGKQWRKFAVYSLCSWTLPAKLALTAVLVDLCPAGLVADAFRPHFGVRACWFGRGPSMLVFFGVPVLAVLVCNAGFFLSSAYMIYSSHSMTRYSASPGTKRDFRLYARLAVIMGMTWISGLLAALADSEILWVVFILSNASLGLFVFVAFTCRSKVLRALKNLKRDSVLNLPAAFSWSMNPSEADAKSHHVRSSSSSATDSTSEKPTSNTYY